MPSGVQTVTTIVYAPGVQQVRWNGMAISFSNNNCYVVVTKSYHVPQSIAAPNAVTGIVNGTGKSSTGLGLPSQVNLETDNGEVPADVVWDVDGSDYDPGLNTEQTFQVAGTASLPDGVVNPNQVSLNTAISVTVRALPSTTATLNPVQPDGQNEWYVHPITVYLAAQENTSDVLKTEYSLDGGATWKLYTAPFKVDQDGDYQMSYRSTDLAGKVEDIKTVNLKLDQTSPSITVTNQVSDLNSGTADDGVDNIYSDAASLVPDVSLSDKTSGMDEERNVTALDSNGVQPGERIDLYILPLGLHSLVVSAGDQAGNEVSTTVTFQTQASVEGLKQLVIFFTAHKWIDNAGLAESLQQKLEHQDLQSFINEVKAQSGKHITDQASVYLLRDANALVN